MKKKLLLVLGLAIFLCLLSASIVCAEMVKAEPGTDLTAADIKTIYPQTVVPGTLFSINGVRFGETPGRIFIGDVAIDEFVSWDNNVIWLRIPEGIKTGSHVMIGEAVSKETVNLAPEGSIRVVWKVDFGKAQEMVNAKSAEYGLKAPAKFKAPFRIKGQWVKFGAKAGEYDSGWNGGSNAILYHEADSDVWTSEFVFTRENVQALKLPMYFAFEDANFKSRNLGPFESDAAFILKREWALSDAVDASDTDPGVMLTTDSKLFNPKDNTITLTYPLEK